jgi:hypothetical protein
MLEKLLAQVLRNVSVPKLEAGIYFRQYLNSNLEAKFAKMYNLTETVEKYFQFFPIPNCQYLKEPVIYVLFP